MLEIIGTIIFGAVIGALARLVMRGNQNLSVIATVFLGVIGVVVANIVLALVGYPQDTPGIDWIRWIVSVLLAVVAISIYLRIRGRRTS